MADTVGHPVIPVADGCKTNDIVPITGEAEQTPATAAQLIDEVSITNIWSLIGSIDEL